MAEPAPPRRRAARPAAVLFVTHHVCCVTWHARADSLADALCPDCGASAPPLAFQEIDPAAKRPDPVAPWIDC